MNYSDVWVNPVLRNLEYLKKGELKRRLEALQGLIAELGLGAVIVPRNRDGWDRFLNNIYTFGPLNEGLFIVPAGGCALATQGYALLENGRAKGREALALYDEEGELVNWLTDCDLLDLLGDRLTEDGMAEDEDIHSVKSGNCKLVSGLGYKDILDFVGEKGRLGLAYPDDMRADVYEYLEKHLPEVELVDVTRDTRAFLAEKSGSDIDCLYALAKQHDNIIKRAGLILREGRTERQAVDELRYTAYREGAYGFAWYDNVKIDLFSTPDDGPLESLFYPGRELGRGDRVSVKLHSVGLGGWFGGIARGFTLGGASPETLKKWQDAVAAEDFAASQLIPGVTLGEVRERVCRWLRERGYNEPREDFIYSLGYACKMAPDTRLGGDIPLKENMALFVCVPVGAEKAGEKQSPAYSCGDMYRLTENGAERMTKAPRVLESL